MMTLHYILEIIYYIDYIDYTYIIYIIIYITYTMTSKYQLTPYTKAYFLWGLVVD